MERVFKFILVATVASLSFCDINAMRQAAKILVTAPVIKRISIISRTLPAPLNRTRSLLYISSLKKPQDNWLERTREPITAQQQAVLYAEEVAFLKEVQNYYIRCKFPLVEAHNDYVKDFENSRKILALLNAVHEENLKASDAETQKIAAEVTEEIARLSEEQEATKKAISIIESQEDYIRQSKAKSAQDAAKEARDNASCKLDRRF